MHLLLILFLLIAVNVAADQKIFYDSVTDTQIVDVSGQKTKAQIEEEFNLSDVEEVAIDSTKQAYNIKNGKIDVYDFVKANKAIKDAKDAEIKIKEDKIKAKLSLSESDWKDLKDAILGQ